MKINIEVDDELYAKAKKAARTRSTKATVKKALELMGRKPPRLLELKGKIKFRPGYDHEDL